MGWKGSCYLHLLLSSITFCQFTLPHLNKPHAFCKLIWVKCVCNQAKIEQHLSGINCDVAHQYFKCDVTSTSPVNRASSLMSHTSSGWRQPLLLDNSWGPVFITNLPSLQEVVPSLYFWQLWKIRNFLNGQFVGYKLMTVKCNASVGSMLEQEQRINLMCFCVIHVHVCMF
jgi:hypothetical protein